MFRHQKFMVMVLCLVGFSQVFAMDGEYRSADDEYDDFDLMSDFVQEQAEEKKQRTKILQAQDEAIAQSNFERFYLKALPDDVKFLDVKPLLAKNAAGHLKTNLKTFEIVADKYLGEGAAADIKNDVRQDEAKKLGVTLERLSHESPGAHIFRLAEFDRSLSVTEAQKRALKQGILDHIAWKNIQEGTNWQHKEILK